jgi:hypothetical protein
MPLNLGLFDNVALEALVLGAPNFGQKSGGDYVVIQILFPIFSSPNLNSEASEEPYQA